MTVHGMDLVRTTTTILRHCNLKPGDEVVLYADTGKSPALVDAFFAAAMAADVEPLLAIFPQRRAMLQEPSASALSSMKQATMVVDLATDPWLYTDGLNAILDAGGRVLQVLAAESTLAKMPPTAGLIRRAKAAADMFEKAKEVRIRSDGGTDLVANCQGRPGWGQDGVVREPGDWDSAGTSILACAPLEDEVNGAFVIEPGDFVWTIPREILVEEPITLTVESGRLTSVEGGEDAKRLARWLASFEDPNSYVFAHTGFGGDPRASIDQPLEAESIEGGINVAFGGNIFRGLGGRTKAKSHVDIVVMKQTMFLDDECVVKDGKIVHPDLAVEGSGA
jgi:2,5-dihydroxypyridine 5,6-dioxygenase